MRTTLTIDGDVLAAARDLSRAQGVSIGQVISDLARRGLTQPAPSELKDEFFGFCPLPRRGVVVTDELIDTIREEEGV
ncbi:MAG: antitoxin [Micrococcales bacterium]|nr:antitoxin [Micrococcales bacterium]